MLLEEDIPNFMVTLQENMTKEDCILKCKEGYRAKGVRIKDQLQW